MSKVVPILRIRYVNEASIKPAGEWVLYWMTAFRRTSYNFALDRSIELAKQLDRPLLILEALRLRYRWASDRMHQFVIQGMLDNQTELQSKGVTYFPYVELKQGTGSGLVYELARRACAVVTDDYPCFFHPRMIQLSGRKTPVHFEAIDSNCLMPLDFADRTFTVAHSYRRWMQKELPAHLQEVPKAKPFSRSKFKPLNNKSLQPIFERWPVADLESLLKPDGLSKLAIDHDVLPAPLKGGSDEAERMLKLFLNSRLNSYDEDRNEPDELGSSELSPYLHFGHISAHKIFETLMQKENWDWSKVKTPNGKVNGFWGVSESAEAFLDQLCTWREIGFNMCWRKPKTFDKLRSLPDWTQKTIREHASDEREYVYSLEQFEKAKTHDEIWNAAQRQLVREGRIHNYLRMLWGKKILHWTANIQEAMEIMIHLNNKYALDGRDPNSYSGIFWVLGRYDRAWGPERPIFGKIRYMTSENTAKKHKLKQYLKRFAE